MKINSVKTLFFASFMCFLFIFGAAKTFAAPPSSADEDDTSGIDDRENKTDEALNQIQESGSGFDPKQEDALAKSLNQLNAQSAAAQNDAINYATDNKSVKKALPQPVALVPVAVTPAQEARSPSKTLLQEVTPEIQAPVEPSPGWQFKKENQYVLGTEVSHVAYKEPGLMHENGPYIGVYGGYYARPKEFSTSIFNVFHADAHLNIGWVNYKGTGEVHDIKDYLFEPRMWLGKDFELSPSAQLTPYIGLGYRFLFDSLSEAKSGGYDRRSQYLYLPLGLETRFQLPHGWQLGLNGEYDIFLRGWQTSYLSNADPDFPDLNNEQHNGYGLRGSIDFIKNMGKFNFVLSPYIRYWNIKQSVTNVASTNVFEVIGVEPDNHSTEVGLRVSVEY